MSDRACKACGGPLPTQHGGRLYCSERCRKAQYDLVCVDCGGRVSGTDPGKIANPDEPVCATCWAQRWGELAADRERARVAERWELIEALWAAGLSIREIASRLDTTKDSLSVTMVHMRRAGRDLPYRYNVENGRRVA